MEHAGLGNQACGELRDAAVAVLRKNDRGTYSVPTHGLYPMQFNWDSAFASLGYRWLEPERAWSEIETLLSAQQADGRVPHIMFRGDHEGYFPGPEIWQCGTEQLPISGISNPPVAAAAVRRLIDSGARPSEERLRAMLAALARWHLWFMDCRLDSATGAILIVHPWESGRDNMCDWDAAMQRVSPRKLPPYQRRDLEHVDAAQRPTHKDYDRYLEIVACGVDVGWDQRALVRATPFLMVDVGMTAMLLRASRDLDTMLTEADMPRERQATASITERLEKGLHALWSADLAVHVSYDPVERKHCSAISSASFLTPFAGLADSKQLASLMEHFDRFADGNLPVASFDPEHEHFDSKCYHRGPVWMPVNLLIEIGLDEVGEHERAEKIRSESLQTMASQGLCEYYDPIAREGLGGEGFTWTAAAALDWLNIPRSRDEQQQA